MNIEDEGMQRKIGQTVPIIQLHLHKRVPPIGTFNNYVKRGVQLRDKQKHLQLR